MTDFHFKHSNTEHTYSEDGKSRTYKVCDICGAEQQNNYGLEVSHARSGAEGSYRLSLCGKCANKILPILEGALDEIHATVNELRNDTQPRINLAIMATVNEYLYGYYGKEQSDERT